MQEKVIKHIKGKYSPEAIILHGSRASGNERENSDWDLFIFTKEDISGGPERFEGESLDIKVLNLPINIEEFVDRFAYALHDAKILSDNEENLGEGIIEKGKAKYKEGKKLSKEEYQNRFNYMKRTLDRMSGNVEKPELFLLHLGVFYEKAFQYWFETKDRYSMPVYKAVEVIKKEDEEYYKLLEILFSKNNNNENKVEAGKKIFSKLFNS